MKKYVLWGVSLLLTACNESYPGLYAPVIDEDNPNPEVSEDRVPVKLSATDPSFGIVTRGMGAFEDWSNEENRERWRNADFYVYGFLGKNHEYSGTVNYAGEEVNYAYPLNNDDGRIPHCLVKNRRARFNGAAEPTLEWEDGYQPYYSVSYPDYMFNFFVYHIDDALQLTSPTYEASRVVYHIGIDGTQDVISGYAHATESDTENVGDNDESRYLWNNWQKLIYSARSGHRQIHPRFFIEHRMTRLNFNVKGASPQFSNKIQILAVGVKSRWIGDFTVARDWQGGWSWSEDADKPQLDITWGEEKKDMYVATPDTPQEYGATYEQGKCLFDPMVTVEYEESCELGDIMLPPDDKYNIFIRYKITDRPNEIFTANYSNVGFADEGKIFEAGKIYEVTLRIYGPQSIALQVSGTGLSWLPGDDLDVDKGEDEYE